MAFHGKYLEVTPPSRLVWTNEEAGRKGQITTVTFEERGSQTLLVVHDLGEVDVCLEFDLLAEDPDGQPSLRDDMGDYAVAPTVLVAVEDETPSFVVMPEPERLRSEPEPDTDPATSDPRRESVALTRIGSADLLPTTRTPGMNLNEPPSPACNVCNSPLKLKAGPKLQYYNECQGCRVLTRPVAK